MEFLKNLLDWERVLEIAGDGAIGRPHIAYAMLEKGYIILSPYDLIVIDCPLYNFKKQLVEQLNPNQGRLIYIEKLNDEQTKKHTVAINICRIRNLDGAKLFKNFI